MKSVEEWQGECDELRIIHMVATDHATCPARGLAELKGGEMKGKMVVAVEDDLCVWGTPADTRPLVPKAPGPRVQGQAEYCMGTGDEHGA
jgi:hypothetical protein